MNTSAKSRDGFAFLLIVSILGMIFMSGDPVHAQVHRTDPRSADSDHDGYPDGPDRWDDGEWIIGEDKNGNGRYEPEGDDGILGTEDDESDPNNPRSRPREEMRVRDTDGDGLRDEQEDVNRNGEWDDGELNFRDADTDDDGLSDFFEYKRNYNWERLLSPDSRKQLRKGLRARHPLIGLYRQYPRGHRPDTDSDGLPDGLEMGVSEPIQSKTLRDGTVIGGTDLDAEFEYAPGLFRKCFIPDQDPASVTDPHGEDSNDDGIDDGESDANANGRADEGETDAAAGWNALSRTLTLLSEVLYLGGNRAVEWKAELDDDGGIDPDSLELPIAFQAPLGDEGDPDVHLSSDAVLLDRIERVAETRLFRIHLKWNRASEESEEPILFWIESNNLPGGSTPKVMMRTTSPSNAAAGAPGPTPTPTPSGPLCTFDKPSVDCPGPPDLVAPPAREISWYCVVPPPLPEHWCRDVEDRRALDLSSEVMYAHQLQGLADPSSHARRAFHLTELLEKYFFAGEENPSVEVLERQWLMAMIWAEIGGAIEDPSDQSFHNYVAFQKTLLLTGITPCAQLAYVYGRPRDWGGAYTWIDSIDLTKDNKALLTGYKVRLYHCIDSDWSGAVPHDEFDTKAQNTRWKDLMEWNLSDDYKSTYPDFEVAITMDPPLRAQWRMKKISDMRPDGQDWKDPYDFHESRKKVQNLLAVALAARMILEDKVWIYDGTATSGSGAGSRFLRGANGERAGNFFTREYERGRSGAINFHPPHDFWGMPDEDATKENISLAVVNGRTEGQHIFTRKYYYGPRNARKIGHDNKYFKRYPAEKP